MPDVDEYYYRGTTPGWPGSLALQKLPMTCTTTDPLVATLFAIECLSYGSAVVMLVPQVHFRALIGPSNFADAVEAAVNLTVAPADFARHATRALDALTSRDILGQIGFTRVPPRINGKGALRIALEQSATESDRLSDEQILEYNRRAPEVLR